MPEEDLLRSRRLKLTRLRDLGIDPYPGHVTRTHSIKEAIELYSVPDLPSKSDKSQIPVNVTGRIMALRVMGKLTFADVRDGTGRMQVLFRADALGDEYGLIRELDLGDFIGISGHMFLTRTNEITLNVSNWMLLTKSLRPLPEKWHGLTDIEAQHRYRYLDLIANPRVADIFLQRSKIINALRQYLADKGFIEVETPILVPIPAGALARPFVTHHNALDQTLYLRIATELYLKRLMVGGLDKVYELGRVFRNEGIDHDHNPEFTLLESYEAYSDYLQVMIMVEDMIREISKQAIGTHRIEFSGQTIDLSSPWTRISFTEAIQQYSGFNIKPYIEEELPLEQLADEIRNVGIDLGSTPNFKILDKLFSVTVEPNLVQPTFVLDYPVAMSPLAKRKQENHFLAERFEGFMGGMEIANSFTELNDPDEQRKRFEDQEIGQSGFYQDEIERMDPEFLIALEHGMPPTGGLGMGIDRLVMILTGQSSIRDVLLFPQMRTRLM